MNIETLAVHAGHDVDPATGALAPPIHLSTTFERDPDGGYARGYIYSRSSNPNRDALEQAVCALEGGAAGAAFSSGSAATMAVLQSLAPGDHVIAPSDVYHGTTRLLKEVFAPWGLRTTFVDMTDTTAVERVIESRTSLVWMETPSNPMLKIVDVARIAEIAHAAGARCACDNTWATPVLQRPFRQGVDLIVHSSTKYLGGHHDVLGGLVIAREQDEAFDAIRKIQGTGGAVPSPFECWLVLRGLPTLACRIRTQSETANALATFLSAHPAVESVHYPGLSGHPGHARAASQMDRFGAVLSFQVKGGQERAFAVAAKVRLFTRATSLGGPESLIEHRASVEGPETRTPANLLRVSAGLENPDDLIEDLDQALAD
jgi:cystathionine gamma-synthase